MNRGDFVKYKWTNETAQKYINSVEKGKEPMGMKYLSAKDFLKNHRILSRYSIIGI